MDEYKTDVLVVGSGGAGLRAAIAAREEGCDVVVLSKCSPGLATCTAISNGAAIALRVTVVSDSAGQIAVASLPNEGAGRSQLDLRHAGQRTPGPSSAAPSDTRSAEE